jgi:hypothetical protein
VHEPPVGDEIFGLTTIPLPDLAPAWPEKKSRHALAACRLSKVTQMIEKTLLRIFREELATLILSQTACPDREKAEMDAASEFFVSELSDLERYSKAYEYLARGKLAWHKAGCIHFERTARKNARRIFDQDREEIASWYGNLVHQSAQ